MTSYGQGLLSFCLVTPCWPDIHAIILKTLMPVLLVYNNFSDPSPSLWKWRQPTWSEGGGSCQVIIVGFVFSQFEHMPSPDLSRGWAVAVVRMLGALLGSMVLVLGLASCSFMSLPEMKVCFATDRRCCRSLWFSCLLEAQVILFFYPWAFYGKVKGWGRLFCNLLLPLTKILYLFCTTVCCLQHMRWY